MAKKKQKRKEQAQGFTLWLKQKRPFLQFAGIFGVLMGVFYVFTVTPLFKDYFSPVYLQFNTDISAFFIKLFGQSITVHENTIMTTGFSINIKRGCDASGPIALFISGVLAFPSPWRRKLAGLAAGVVALIILNIIRIISLYFIGLYLPDLFHVMHVDVWQAIFVILAFFLWFVWAEWAVPVTPNKAESNPIPNPAKV